LQHANILEKIDAGIENKPAHPNLSHFFLVFLKGTIDIKSNITLKIINPFHFILPSLRRMQR
jgi:hypothetical protein